MAIVLKDPGTVLSYGLDWSDFGANDGAAADPGWLQGDTISVSVWAITGPDALLINDTDDNSTTSTSITLSGGTAGYSYKATNHITTAAGFEDERTIQVKVVNR